MVIDTSAVIAILLGEPERSRFNKVIEDAGSCLMSVVTYVESSMFINLRKGYEGVRDLDLLIAAADIELVPVDIEQAHMARQAFQKYGKGRHVANLNFGDCFSYALAKSAGLPLLFKGNDFRQTDITPACLKSAPNSFHRPAYKQSQSDRPG